MKNPAHPQEPARVTFAGTGRGFYVTSYATRHGITMRYALAGPFTTAAQAQEAADEINANPTQGEE